MTRFIAPNRKILFQDHIFGGCHLKCQNKSRWLIRYMIKSLGRWFNTFSPSYRSHGGPAEIRITWRCGLEIRHTKMKLEIHPKGGHPDSTQNVPCHRHAPGPSKPGSHFSPARHSLRVEFMSTFLWGKLKMVGFIDSSHLLKNDPGWSHWLIPLLHNWLLPGNRCLGVQRCCCRILKGNDVLHQMNISSPAPEK